VTRLELEIKQVREISKYKQDFLYWSIGYIDLSYQFNTSEYYKDDLEGHLLKTYARGGTLESKSKTGFFVKFKKSIVSAHGKITFKLAELSLKNRICEEWCKHEKFRAGGRYAAEIGAVVSGMILLTNTGETHLVERASPFFAGLFLIINKKLDDYCDCIEKKIKNKDRQKSAKKNANLRKTRIKKKTVKVNFS